MKLISLLKKRKNYRAVKSREKFERR